MAAALGDDANYAATVTTSLASKQATITGAATTITSSNLTASRALVSNSNSKVAVSAVTSTELGYLGGVKSSIQTQLDLKARLASPTFTGTVGGLDKTMVGLGNVDNYSKATMFTSPTFTGQVTATSGFIGDVTGNATTVTVTAENITSGTRYLTFVDSGTGPNSIKRDANLHYNPSNNMITAGGFYGTIYTAAQPQITSVGTLSSLNVNGNVGIGTTSPTNKLEVNGVIETLYNNAHSGSSLKDNELWRNNNGDFYIQYSSSGKLILCQGGGNVGIGTSSPECPLHVTKGVQSNLQQARFYASWTNHGNAGLASNPQNINIGIKSTYGIWTNGNLWSADDYSDIRIKENIIDVPDALSLQKLRDISCSYYEYKDKLKRGYDQVIGFIAQQVKEHLPMAVTTAANIIPNEMRNLQDISWIGTDMSCNLTDVSGIKYCFYVSNDVSNNDEIMKEVIGNEDNTFTFDTSYNNVFCYGKEVDDFHILKKDKLFALNFSATQEIDKIQQEEKAKLAAAETEITTLKDKVTSLETTITDLVARLTALETA